MYLFSRRARLAPGNTRDAMTWATSITEKVNQIVGLNTSLFAQTYSPEVGTLVWSTFVPDLATLESANDKLLVDDSYVSMADEGAKFAQGGVDDALLQIISGEPDTNRQIEYATTVQAVCASGNLIRGVELGVEIAQRAKKITGRPTSFGASQTGVYGAVGWIALYDSVDQVQKADTALATDKGFAELLDKEASKAYLAGVSTQTLYRRVV